MFEHNASFYTPVGFYVGRTAKALAHILSRRFQEAGYDISLQQFVLLTILQHSPGISATDLSTYSHKDKTTITRLLQHLFDKNLVQRSSDPTDQRRHLLTLTPTGQSLHQDLLRHVQAADGHVLAGIDEAEWAATQSVLLRMYENILQLGPLEELLDDPKQDHL